MGKRALERSSTLTRSRRIQLSRNRCIVKDVICTQKRSTCATTQVTTRCHPVPTYWRRLARSEFLPNILFHFGPHPKSLPFLHHLRQKRQSYSTAMPLSKSEKTYIQTSLQSPNPSRADGRPLYDYRSIAIETGVAPLANGSVRVNIGKNSSSGGGTEVLGAVKLEVENVGGTTDGRITCSVSWCVAYPYISRV